MKILFTLLFAVGCSLPAFAQSTFDYMLFRPGVQYLYQNAPEENSFESPLLGMNLAAVDQDSFATAYLSAKLEDGDVCGGLIPSFAGRSILQAPDGVLMRMDSAGTDTILLKTSASAGTSWVATPTITGKVDSIRTEDFLTLTDEVKYISFFRTADGTPLASPIRISKRYGLLTGTYFRELETTTFPLELISLNNPMVGPQLPRLDDVFAVPEGTELNIIRKRGRSISVVREQQLVIDGFDYEQGDDAIRLYFLINEYGYSAAASVPDLQFDIFSRENVRDSFFYSATDLAYLNAQPGEAILSFNPYRIVEAKLFDCFEVGVQRSRPSAFLNGDSCQMIFTDGATDGYFFRNLGGPYFTGGAFSAFQNDLVGAFNDEVDCGESLDITIIPGNVELAESFPWQLFRPGVQYSYGSIEEPDDAGLLPDYAGIRLSGNGTERLAPTARQDDAIPGFDARLGPSYFGKSVYQSPDSTSLAYSNFTVYLRSAATIGESWSINESYEATIDSIREETFFELTDSVKYISFANSDGSASEVPGMRISKNYGLLNAVDFELRDNPNLALAGMSSPEVGLQVPSFASITDFQVGDRLDKRFNIRDVDENGFQINNITEQQLTVERVNRITDSLVQVQFLLHELNYTTGQFGISDSVFDGFQTEIITYDLREQPYLSAQYNQVFDSGFGSFYVARPAGNDCGSDEELGIALNIYGNVEDDLISYFIFDFGGIFHNRVVGPYEQSIEGAETINRLLYQSNATATCGTPLDFDDLISGTNDPVFDDRIRLYPNPASDRITLEIPADLGRARLRIYGADGRLLRTTAAVTGNRSVSIERLTPGIYTVMVVNESGWVGRRRVVVR